MVFKVRGKTLFYFDSLVNSLEDKLVYPFLDYMSVILNALYDDSLNGLNIVEVPKQDSFACQTDGSNCGTFGCIYAKMLILSRNELIIKDKDLNLARSEIAEEVLSEKLHLSPCLSFSGWKLKSVLDDLPPSGYALQLSETKVLTISTQELKDKILNHYESLLSDFRPRSSVDGEAIKVKIREVRDCIIRNGSFMNSFCDGTEIQGILKYFQADIFIAE